MEDTLNSPDVTLPYLLLYLHKTLRHLVRFSRRWAGLWCRVVLW